MSAEARQDHYLRRTKLADEMLLWVYDRHMEDGPEDTSTDEFWIHGGVTCSGLEADRASFWLLREGFIVGDGSGEVGGLVWMEPTGKGDRFVESGRSVAADNSEAKHVSLSITSFDSNISIDSPGSTQSTRLGAVGKGARAR